MAHIRRMDDKEFKARLSAVADWRIPKTELETTKGAKKRRGRKTNDEKYMELREEIFQQEFDGVNPTIPPMLTRLKKSACVCEDCGEYCPNGREKEAKLHQKNGKKVWRQKCLTCDKFHNPFTGKFELTGSAASIKFNDFMKETKGIYNTQGNQNRKTVMTAKQTVIEDDREKITFYHEKNTDA